MVQRLRHVVEHMADVCPVVQTLDAPVPQMVDTVLEFFRALDLPVGEQVIAVPKISTDRVSQRLVERRLPQMVEQLVDVPTVLSPLRIAEQIVGIPAPQRGGNWSPLPGQSSTLSPLRNAFLSGLWSRSLSLLLQNAFLSGLWSRSLLVEIFLLVVQVLVSFSRDRVQQLLVPSSSPTLFLGLITWMNTCPSLPSGCCSVPPPRTGPFTGTDAPMRLPGSHLRASMSSGLVRSPREEESGTGTRVPVPVHMTSLLCLLSEAFGVRGLASPHPFLGAICGMCYAALLVPLHLALCSLLASSGLGCPASWPIWTRRTVLIVRFTTIRQWHVQVCFTGDSVPRVVFPLVVAGPFALLHGRYGP